MDAGAYQAYARELDQVALGAMLCALRELGLFTTPAAHTLEEVLAGGRIAPAHHRLVRRWLAALAAHGHLRRDRATGALSAVEAGTPDGIDLDPDVLHGDQSPATGPSPIVLREYRLREAG